MLRAEDGEPNMKFLLLFKMRLELTFNSQIF